MQVDKMFKISRIFSKYIRYDSNVARCVHCVTTHMLPECRHPSQKNEISRLKAPVESGSLVSFSTTAPDAQPINRILFEKVCEETLESLTDYFEEIVEASENFKLADVSYSTGVLTVNLGPKYGTYVINRQSPNKQIWLSSPTSGPKRYDFVPDGNFWVYKHDGQTLHRLLQEELSKIADVEVDFSRCSYGKL